MSFASAFMGVSTAVQYTQPLGCLSARGVPW